MTLGRGLLATGRPTELRPSTHQLCLSKLR